MPYFPVPYDNPHPRPTDWEEWMQKPGRRVYMINKHEDKERKRELHYYQAVWDEYDASLKAAAEKEYYRYQPDTVYFKDKLLETGLTDEQVELIKQFVMAVIDEEYPTGENQHE